MADLPRPIFVKPMTTLLLQIDDLLRQRWTVQTRPGKSALLWLGGCVLVFGMFYGAVMGTFCGLCGDRLWQVVISALKVPLLLLGTALIAWPNFFVLNTLFGLRRDFVQATAALMAAQAGLAVVLASLAPLTVVWYASSDNYAAALRFNGLVFAIASFAGQWLLRSYYRPLIERNAKHRWMLWMWLVIYVFVGIQMAWILRPFVGAPNAPIQFFRHETWENAYVIVARLIYDALVR
jgi:hypothetical protein